MKCLEVSSALHTEATASFKRSFYSGPGGGTGAQDRCLRLFDCSHLLKRGQQRQLHNSAQTGAGEMGKPNGQMNI